MRLRAKLPLLLILACCNLQAATRTLKLCKIDEDYGPISFPLREAPGQYLIRSAIEHQGDKADIIAAPWRRCLEGVRMQEYDGVVGPAPNEAFLPFMSFPLRDGRPDGTRGLGNIQFMVLRLAGSRVGWDGERFDNSSGPVLYPTNIVIVRDKLARHNVAGSDGAKNSVQVLRMLLVQRSDVATIRKFDAEVLLRDPEFRGKLEMLPVPFVSFDAYFGVRRSLYESDPAYFNEVWNEIGRLRAAPDWPATAQRLLAR